MRVAPRREGGGEIKRHDPIVKGAGDQAAAVCRECEPVERPLVYPGWMVLVFGSRRFCNAAARKHRSDPRHYRPKHAKDRTPRGVSPESERLDDE